MKKNVKDFLNYIEKETSIAIDLTTASSTQKFSNLIGKPVLVDVVGINKSTLRLVVKSCGCKNCNNVICIDILHGDHAGELSHAKRFMNEIKSIVPTIDVTLTNVTYDE